MSASELSCSRPVLIFLLAVAFAYVEKLLHASDPSIAVASALSTLEATPQLLERVGFEKMVFEDFYEVLEQLVKNVVSAEASVFDQRLTEEMLLDAFQSPESAFFIIRIYTDLYCISGLASNSIVVYMRMLTSAQIRLDPDNFAPFLFHPELGEMMEIREFCEHFVDATGKEAGGQHNKYPII